MNNHIPLKNQPLFWDIAITVAVLGAVGLTIGGAMFDGTGGWICMIIGAVGTALILYGSFIEPRIIHVNKKLVHISGLPSIAIGIMADQHCGPYKGHSFIRRTVVKMNGLKPDLILLPGDFLYDHRYSLEDLKPLKDLTAPLGVYAVIGNHDSGEHIELKWFGQRRHYHLADRSDEIAVFLTSLGIRVLRNESLTIDRNGTRFTLAGIDDLWMKSANIEAALKNIEYPIVLLSHNPDVILNERYPRAALIVCGHTHGGQVRLPLIGSLARIPTKIGRRYDHGIFRLKNGVTLAITHGIGETMARARLFCPPEIMLLTVTS